MPGCPSWLQPTQLTDATMSRSRWRPTSNCRQPFCRALTSCGSSGTSVTQTMTSGGGVAVWWVGCVCHVGVSFPQTGPACHLRAPALGAASHQQRTTGYEADEVGGALETRLYGTLVPHDVHLSHVVISCILTSHLMPQPTPSVGLLTLVPGNHTLTLPHPPVATLLLPRPTTQWSLSLSLTSL